MAADVPARAEVAVIGGGILGVSTLYHLARRGHRNVVLLERLELTAGSTWHAAGNLPHFSGSREVMRLQQYSIALYRELGGGAIGHHPTGALRLAHTRQRMDEFHRVAGMANALGLDFRVLTPRQLVEINPLLSPEGLLGGLYDPADGHIDPAGVTQEMARRARADGATILQRCAVEGIERENGRWVLRTQRGRITAEVVVNAAGYRANEVAAMVGHRLPMASMEHQYLVTDRVADLTTGWEMPMVRDPDVSYYLRHEGNGFILGPYEPDGRPWAVDGVPASFGQELLPPSLDRLEHIVTQAMEQVPALASAGIKTVVNGPITYTPDGHPLIGPVTGIDDYIVCTGSNFGIVQGGGAGKYAADWIIDGYPEQDLRDCDPRRFGDFADAGYVVAKCAEVYTNEYALALPHEYGSRPAARPGRTSPLYESLLSRGAAFELVFGWETPAWFDPDGLTPGKITGFRRGPWDKVIAAECLAVRRGAGVADLSAATKFRVTGGGASEFLASRLATTLPSRDGDAVAGHALTARGGVDVDLIVARPAADEYFLVAAITDQERVRQLLDRPGGDVEVREETADLAGILLAGPRAGHIVRQLDGWADAGLADLAPGSVAKAGAMLVLAMDEIGEPSFRVYADRAQMPAIYDQVRDIGGQYGIADIGWHALASLRLEARVPAGADLLPTEPSAAAGLLTWLEVDALDADAFGAEPVYRGDEVVGRVTSGGFGHTLGTSLAFAYLDASAAVAGTELQVEILGERRPARVAGMPAV